jgi:hypothetical protein
MQMNYNLTSDELWNMSWRRFSVLFHHIFNWTDGEEASEGSLPEHHAKGGSRRSHYEQAVHEAQGAAGEISRSFDWDKALGREAPDSRDIITTQELLSGSKSAGGNRVET